MEKQHGSQCEKEWGLTICIDPQALNAALKCELYPLPLIDDILPELNKARIFSKFDLRNAIGTVCWMKNLVT